MADIRAFFRSLLPKDPLNVITGTVLNEGEADEVRALDVVDATLQKDEDGNLKVTIVNEDGVDVQFDVGDNVGLLDSERNLITPAKEDGNLETLLTAFGEKGEDSDFLTILKSFVYEGKVLVQLEGITAMGELPSKELVSPMVIKESFDESDLVSDDYTVVFNPATDIMGFGITNNSETDSLIMEINNITIPVKPEKTFYGLFMATNTITITGTGLDFDAVLEGAYTGEEPVA